MAHHPHGWMYKEGMLMCRSSGTTKSSYSIRETIPERDSIPMINLSDSEIVEGQMAQGVELGVSIEEDPSEPEFDFGMVLKPEGVAPVDAEGMDTLAAGGLPILNDIYDTLKYEDPLRVTFVAFRLRGMAKEWWLRAFEARALKNQPST
ncbi:hypothetical protein M9H77_23098 [Catharanthus roseus]|uniref:Uncharacterized protein n=1 Tax=Catharanthus roseus TaxID=4058 RepID=A0ACC0ASB8_CATRO|nr:hypothetical protein M9H77_23098 [Catharanthus roseus]